MVSRRLELVVRLRLSLTLNLRLRVSQQVLTNVVLVSPTNNYYVLVPGRRLDGSVVEVLCLRSVGVKIVVVV